VSRQVDHQSPHHQTNRAPLLRVPRSNPVPVAATGKESDGCGNDRKPPKPRRVSGHGRQGFGWRAARQPLPANPAHPPAPPETLTPPAPSASASIPPVVTAARKDSGRCGNGQKPLPLPPGHPATLSPRYPHPPISSTPSKPAQRLVPTRHLDFTSPVSHSTPTSILTLWWRTPILTPTPTPHGDPVSKAPLATTAPRRFRWMWHCTCPGKYGATPTVCLTKLVRGGWGLCGHC
jgi:hypothetical protein